MPIFPDIEKPNTPPCSPNEDEHNGAISIAKLPFHVKIPRDPVIHQIHLNTPLPISTTP